MDRDISVNFYENSKKSSPVRFPIFKLGKGGFFCGSCFLLLPKFSHYPLFLFLSLSVWWIEGHIHSGIYILRNWKANNSVQKSLVHCLGNRRKLWMSFQQGNFSFRFILLWLIFDFGWNNNIWVLADYLYNSSKMNFIQKYAWSLYTVQ